MGDIDLHIDSLGIDHEDDIDHSEEEEEEEEEENDDVLAATIRGEALNPNWNIVQGDPMIINSWRAFNSNVQELEGRTFFSDQLFDSVEELKFKLTEFSMQTRKPYRTSKANRNWYTVICDRKDNCGCPWRLSARRIEGTLGMWKVVNYSGPHAQNCVGEVMQLDHRNVNANFIRGEILGFIRKDQDTKPSTIIEHMEKRYGICVSYDKAWNAKQKAISEIYGDWEESYTDLPRFMAALQATNPGTVVEWCNINTPNPAEKMFGRVFWAFAPSIVGFEHCRPLLTIDGTHLYGKYKHVMLIAKAVDANDQILK